MRPQLLPHSGYWALTGIPLRYPIVALYHGDSVALDLQVWALFTCSKQFIDEVDVGMGYLKVMVLGLGGRWFGQPARFLSSSPPE